MLRLFEKMKKTLYWASAAVRVRFYEFVSTLKIIKKGKCG